MLIKNQNVYCHLYCINVLLKSLNHCQTFTAEADQDMAGLLKLYSKMKQEYQTAVKFFGEDSIKMRVDDFFGAFAAFISDFEVLLVT